MKRISVIFLLICSLSVRSGAQTAEKTDSLPPLPGNWVNQVIKSGFHINDPRIKYPKFPKFCLNVYNWGNRTFNTYDSAYVVGTGHNWKLNTIGTVWMQNYGYIFDMTNGEGWDNRVTMRSNLNYDLGAYLTFMAVSVGYTWNINKLAHVHHAPRSSFNFDFSCALFSAELHTRNTTGNTRIERFGRYNGGRSVNIPLDDVHNKLFSVSAYYYFNHRKFSQAAVYKFSKYQLRSAGSWILGFSYIHQQLSLDFSSLPPEVLAYKPASLPLQSNFNFRDFDLMGGYSYNAVMPHNWVFNITLLPSLGYKRSLMPGERPFSEMISLNLYGRVGLTYNHRALFASLQGRADMGFVFNKDYSFFSSTQQASLIVGFRF